jgi:hypothetical protein
VTIAFDNSMTHHAKSPDGLDVGVLKLSDGMSSKTKVLMKPGCFINNDGEKLIQSMQNETRIQKGVRTILQERGKAKNPQGHLLPLQCNYCRTKVTCAERIEVEAIGCLSPTCCASYVLSQEPDFLEQKEWLTEVLVAAGFDIIYFPKYHCELNFIEMVRGWVTSYHRRTCTYNYADLKKRLPDTFLTEMPLAFVRRAFRYCFRFMDGYRQGFDGPLLDFSMKKYSSHRTIPSGVIKTFELDYAAYLKSKKKLIS